MATTAKQVRDLDRAPSARPARWLTARTALWLAIAVATTCTALTLAASTRTSTTFDEIVLMAGGARGYQTGMWDIAPEHPPLMQYIYGLPIFLAAPSYPQAQDAPADGNFNFRYVYSRELFFTQGNDPERLAFLGRSAGALLAGLLVMVAFAFARRFGPAAAVTTAALVAFLPDVLAHGGVAYNDLPLAIGWLLAIWAMDAAVRKPGAVSGIWAGLATALAVGVKFSAVLLLPVAVLLVGAEAISRWRDRSWWPGLGVAVTAALVAGYLGLVTIYRGDLTLEELRYGIGYTFGHVSRGHSAPGYLNGALSTTGWWYFFPVAFLYKTPAALHVLLLAAVVGLARNLSATTLRSITSSPLRAPLIGLAVFTGALLTSSLNIGFRYALPVLPLICVVTGAGTAALWRTAGRELRGALVVLMLWFAGSTLAFYPHFLAYTSEYAPGADRGHHVLLDSSLDWGQGLLDLRNWMDANEVNKVYLSYFGSAVPAGYGIGYEALPSFFPLPPTGPPTGELLQYAVISATNLYGVYLGEDPFARFREMEPDTVIARTLVVFRNDAGN